MITIIYAHPNAKSFNSSIFKAVKLVLDKAEKEYKVIDLYKEKFDPVLKLEELYTAGNYKVAKQSRKYQEMIKNSEKLIFIYPSWWNGLPAILKGFIDRVMVGRFAFKYENGMPIGLLKGRKALVITTTGAPRIMTWLFLGDRNTKRFCRDILGFCGIKARAIQVGAVRKGNQSLEKELMRVKLATLNFVR